jgi:uncharacterized Zn finger protein
MSWYQNYRPYVSVAERRRKAEKKVAALRKKGETIEAVTAATPRGKIAVSFWGKAWCEHLESFSDYANRLPRGRTYLRNGSVLHLAIEPGRIRALVMGSELYEQTIQIAPLPKDRWDAVKKRCQGKIGSLIELLQGKISDDVMKVVTDRMEGLFPGPKEIQLGCSCPDWAGLCKHLAAILYGVGSRLDAAPELLFKLRGVDHTELIQTDAASLVTQGETAGGKGRRRLAPADLGDVFGIELEEEPAPQVSEAPVSPTTQPPSPPLPQPQAARKKQPKKKTTPPKKKTVSKKTEPTTKPKPRPKTKTKPKKSKAL